MIFLWDNASRDSDESREMIEVIIRQAIIINYSRLHAFETSAVLGM